MAGHLPIPTNKFHEGLFFACKHSKKLREAKYYERIRLENSYGGYFQRLPVEDYNMDEETGMIDREVYSFVPDDENSYEIYEIHIGHGYNGELKINQIYLVM